MSARLASLDYTCPSCGYNLRGIAGARCPECGLELTRSRLEFREAHWCTPAFFFGIAGIVLGLAPVGYAVYRIVADSGPGLGVDVADRLNVTFLGGWLIVVGAALVRWVNWSGTMAAWERGRHWACALACWLLPLFGGIMAWRMGVLPL
jgi:predicted RNA-binding Zn-ribbon protein involved in translation (DUF1610 family)